jgi:hypothetical protein
MDIATPSRCCGINMPYSSHLFSDGVRQAPQTFSKEEPLYLLKQLLYKHPLKIQPIATMPMDDIPACQAYSLEVHNAFGYQPSLAAGIVFLALFFLSSCTHLFQAIRYSAIWQGLYVVGAGAECLGWIARTAAWKCSYSTELFTMQIALLIFGSLSF